MCCLLGAFDVGTPEVQEDIALEALSDAVVVLAAAEHPRALATPEAALDLHKEVMAVPGSVCSPLSVAIHGLIRRRGRPVPERTRRARGAGRHSGGPRRPVATPKSLGLALGPGRDGNLSHPSDGLALTAAEIARKLALPAAEVLDRRAALEVDGAVRRHHDGYVRALRKGQERA